MKHLIYLFLLASCNGPYSTLTSAGSASQSINELFWWLLGGAFLLWSIFIVLECFALWTSHRFDKKIYGLFIIGGGMILPVVVITICVYFSLSRLPDLLRPAPAGSLVVKVSGAQWWWRVKYPRSYPQSDGEEIELANEIWLPVNEAVQFLLTTEDVIHSFWVPSLAGKMDLIPNRVNKLSFIPKRKGEYWGVCAEYCGLSHALMRLKVKVVDRKDFDKWLARQETPAIAPAVTPGPGEDVLAQKGKEAFLSNGCISCHTVRGVSSVGSIGPDLTHVGSRLSIGAGILGNEVSHFRQWISQTERIKPGVHMPTYSMLHEEERRALAHWLKSLK